MPRGSGLRIEGEVRGVKGTLRGTADFLVTRGRRRVTFRAVLAYAFAMRCVLGLDGGGTKTECMLLDEQGRVQARSRSGPSNPLRVGVDAAIATLQAAAQEALAAGNAARTDVVAMVAGLAGAGRAEMAERMRAELQRGFPGCAVRVCTDLELALVAVGKSPAVVLVAGTGSAAIGRDAAGNVLRAGGLGPAAGDEGSAYDIGRKAITAAREERERSGAESALGRRILQGLGVSSWEEVQARAREAADEIFPRVFPFVAEEAAAGDATAQGLLREAAAELARLAGGLVERMGLGGMSFALAKAGGLIGRSAYFDTQLDELLRKAAPRAQLGLLAVTPAEAAARLALRLAGGAGRAAEKQ